MLVLSIEVISDCWSLSLLFYIMFENFLLVYFATGLTVFGAKQNVAAECSILVYITTKL